MARRGEIASDASPSVALVREALKATGLRQQELADQTGLSKDHISRILLGKVTFPKGRDTLHALAKALGLDPLQFTEYRQQLQVLPESTRRLTAHLKARGITQADWVQRIVPAYSEGHLQLILRGGSPFPKDPDAVKLFADAAEADPFMFEEYLPLADWRERLEAGADLALDPADAGVFKHLLGKLARGLDRREAEAELFGERLLKRFLARSFGTQALAPDAELDDQLTYLPPIAQYQPAVRAMLRAMYARDLGVGELATASGVGADVLFAVANGQMKLKPGGTQDAVFQALGLGASDVEREA